MHETRNEFTATSQPKPHKRVTGSVTNKSRITNGRWLLATASIAILTETNSLMISIAQKAAKCQNGY
jgi:hypothetical protein